MVLDGPLKGSHGILWPDDQHPVPHVPYLVFGQRPLARGMRSILERAMWFTTGPW